MLKKVLSIYKFPFFIALTLSVAFIAIRTYNSPFGVTQVVLGSLLGAFVLDLDYLIIAYFLEPEKDFSKTLAAFIKHGDFANALTYVEIHKKEIKEKTLNSALFQGVLALFSIFVINSDAADFVKALVLSTLAVSLYRLYEAYFTKETEDWFWILKNNPGRGVVLIYSFVILGVLVYCVRIF